MQPYIYQGCVCLLTSESCLLLGVHCWLPGPGPAMLEARGGKKKRRKGGGSWACCCLPWSKSFGGCMKEGQPLQPVLKCIFWWATLYHSPMGFPCASADYWVSLAGPAGWVVACCGLCCPIHAIAVLFAEENNLKFLSLKYHFPGSLQIEKVICAGRFLSLVLHKWIQTAFLLDHCQGFYLLVTGALASDPFRSSSGANDVCNVGPSNVQKEAVAEELFESRAASKKSSKTVA